LFFGNVNVALLVGVLISLIIAHSDFSNDVFCLLDSSSVPVMLFPFLIAMLIQTAQGSRVVTAIVTAGIVKDLACMQTVFMICAGTFMFSYVSDPYFWLVKHNSSMKENLKYYTLPLALTGVVVLVCAILFL